MFVCHAVLEGLANARGSGPLLGVDLIPKGFETLAGGKAALRRARPPVVEVLLAVESQRDSRLHPRSGWDMPLAVEPDVHAARRLMSLRDLQLKGPPIIRWCAIATTG